MTARVGPFEVVRELAKAPGLTLVEALDSEGSRRLLQLSRFRAVIDERERFERHRHEKLLAQRTAELLQESSMVVHAHGGADADKGERVLFWALPWAESPLLMDRAKAGDLSVETFQDVARRLLARLIDRHAQGRADPSLSEHVLRLDEDGEVRAVTVPLAIDRAWLAPDEPPVRLAPEELEAREARPSGDIWRLGRALVALARYVALPEPLQQAVDRLASDDAAARPSSAQAAMAMLQGAGRGNLYESEETTQMAPLAAPELPDPLRVTAWDVPDSRTEVDTELPIPSLETPQPASFIDSDSVVPRPVPDSEAVTRQTSALLPSAVAPMITDRLDGQKLQDPADRQTGPVVVLNGAPAATEQESPWELLRITVETTEPGAVSPFSQAATDPEAKPHRSDPPKKSEIDPLAAAWVQPVLPAGESPWSEVVTPRGALQRDHARFYGYGGQLPANDPKLTPPPSSLPVVPPPYVPPPPTETNTDETDITAFTGFNFQKLAAGALALLVIFGLFAFLARNRDDPENVADVALAPPSNDVELLSDPSGALVVSEADGRELGKTPLRFLVPGAARAAVYLVVQGYEPLRLELPERGGLKAQLSRLDEPACTLELSAALGAPLEGVGFELKSENGKVQLPGAGLVRAKAGAEAAGARLVLCPGLGGETRQILRLPRRNVPRLLRVTEPAGAMAYVNGDPIGRVPATTRSNGGFAVVRVDDAQGMHEERLVPIPGDVEIRMPAPRPRRAVKVLLPEEDGPTPVEATAIDPRR